MSPGRRRRGSPGAFTLIELVAVVVVLAIVAVTAAPVLTHTSAAARLAGGTQIARDVSYARERALATGTATWVDFDPDLQGYSVLGEDPDAPGRGGASALSDPSGRASYVVDLGTSEFMGVAIESVTVSIAGTDLGFDWLGRPKDGGDNRLTTNATIVIESGPTITVYADTGLVTLTTPTP